MKSTFAKFQEDLAKRIQEVVETDLSKLQAMMQKEVKNLSIKVKKYAGETGLDKKAKEIEKKAKNLEKAALKEYKKFQPTIHKFVNEIKENAARVGIDVEKIEKEILKRAHFAKTKVSAKKPSRSAKSSTSQKTRGTKGGAPKAAATKSSAAKTSAAKTSAIKTTGSNANSRPATNRTTTKKAVEKKPSAE